LRKITLPPKLIFQPKYKVLKTLQFPQNLHRNCDQYCSIKVFGGIATTCNYNDVTASRFLRYGNHMQLYSSVYHSIKILEITATPSTNAIAAALIIFFTTAKMATKPHCFQNLAKTKQKTHIS